MPAEKGDNKVHEILDDFFAKIFLDLVLETELLLWSTINFPWDQHQNFVSHKNLSSGLTQNQKYFHQNFAVGIHVSQSVFIS